MRRQFFAATATAAATALAVLPAATASAHDIHRTGSTSPGLDVPVATSPNVHLLTTVPDTAVISGVFARTGSYFYVSSTDTISVYDTSNPAAPVLKGTLPNLVFENEAMTYGERRNADGSLSRFVLVGVDLFQASAGDPQHVNVGGGEVLVVDVSDPGAPRIRSRVKATTSTHTVTCLNAGNCNYAYTAGTRGNFSVIDLRNLDAPREAKVVASPAAGPNAVFTRGAGHDWDFDAAGLGWHTGSGGSASFNISDPVNPRLMNATNAQGIATPYNDFIHHNSMRPNAKAFRAGAPPSLANGNVLLVTEEDYANDGEELACDQAGTIQTWYVPSLTAATASPTKPSSGNIRPLDISNLPAQFGGGASTPVGGFCSAHWFDTHQSGILAQGYYQQGLRFVDVRDPRNIKQYGYFTGGLSEVWDANWVPQRDAGGVDTGRKTNIVYGIDFAHGIDVLCVNLPGQSTCPAGATATASAAAPTRTLAMAMPLLGVLALLGVATAVRRRQEH